MKNILLIMPYGSVGGMERLAHTFYTYYKQKGYFVKAVKLICLKSDIIHFGEDELWLSTKDFGEMSPAKRLLFYTKAPLRLRKIIKKYNITHSISFGDMTNMFSSLTATSEFKVASIHALKSAEFQNKTPLNSIFKFGFRSTYKSFDKTVCISQAIAKDLVEECGYKFDNLDVIYNPHPVDTIRQRANEDREVFTKMKIPSGKAIVFVGRLSLQKSPWYLLNAFCLAKQKDPDLHLICIGDGEPRVREYIDRLIEYRNIQDVHFLGRKSNPYPYIEQAGVLALSSFYEGTPNVIVEAIALQTPVVTTKCTEGILELMCVGSHTPEHHEYWIRTEAGLITPGVFNGELSIPSFIAKEFAAEEIALSKALLAVVSGQVDVKNTLNQHDTKLLAKFDLETVATDYLRNQAK